MSRTKIKPQRLADYPKVYRDAVTVWGAFRDLGFAADDIFFFFGEVSGQPDHVAMVLKTQGQMFTMVVGHTEGPRARVEKTWKQVAKLVHTSTQEERRALLKEHMLDNRDYYLTFIAAIQAKGILVPIVVEHLPHAGQA